MNSDMAFKEIEALRAEIRTLDERLTKVESKQDKVDEILDRIAILDRKLNKLLGD